VEAQLHTLTSGRIHALAVLSPGKETAVQFCIGFWMGTKAGLETVEKRQVSCPTWGLKPDSSVFQHVTQSLYRYLTERAAAWGSRLH
jgi:hypothetical protein